MLSQHLSPQWAYEVDAEGVFVDEDETTSPLGYRWIHLKYCSKCVLPRYSSWTTTTRAADKGNAKRYQTSDLVYFADGDSVYLSDDTVVDRPRSLIEHLLWALRYEGINLQIMKAVAENHRREFEKGLITEYEKYKEYESFRRVWFFYELFAETEAPVDDLPDSTPPFALFDPEVYVAGPCYDLHARQRLYNNMFGTKTFRPLALKSLISDSTKIKEYLDSRTSELLLTVKKRAANFIRYKETKSTFEIEGEESKSSAARAWCKILRHVQDLPFNSAVGTLEVASSLFPDTPPAKGWRETEIFIGKTKFDKAGRPDEIMYHIGARASDLETLMSGFYETLNACIRFSGFDPSGLDPLLQKNHRLFDKVAVTAILTFSFTIIHPLSDGNGRTHRLLIHYLLEKFGVVNCWLVPVSVIILNDNLKTGAKDAVLAEVSNPIITRTRYSFDEGQITVHNETTMFFESWDATMSVEYFYSLLKKAGRVSIDCGLYLLIWDRCVEEANNRKTPLPPSKLKAFIARYLDTGKVSKNMLKQLEKIGVGEDLVNALEDICKDVLGCDTDAFKESFEPFNLSDQAEVDIAFDKAIEI